MKDKINSIIGLLFVCGIFYLGYAVLHISVGSTSVPVVNNYYDSTTVKVEVQQSKATTPDVTVYNSVSDSDRLTRTELISILNEYRAVRFYSDTIRNDTLEAIIGDSIQNNRRAWLGFQYRWLLPMKSEVLIPEKKRFKLKVGAYGTVDTSRFEFGPFISGELPSGLELFIGKDLLSKSVTFGGVTPIRLRKRGK